MNVQVESARGVKLSNDIWLEIERFSFSTFSIVDLDGTIRMKGPSVERLFGYDPAELKGKPADGLIHPDDKPAVSVHFNRAMMSPGVPIKTSFRYLHKHRGYLDVEAVIINLMDDPHINGILIQYRDNTELVQLYKALQESREHLDLALQGADLGVWDWDLAHNRMYYNHQWAAMLGYKLNEINADPQFWENLLHPEDKPIVLQSLDDHLKGKTEYYQSEHRLLTKSGTYKWILDKGKVVARNPDGTPIRVAGTHLDIDEKKRAEEDLINRSQELAQINRELEEFAYLTSHDLRAPLANLLGLVNQLEQAKLPQEEQLLALGMMRQSIGELSKSMEWVERLTELSVGYKQKFEVVDIDKAWKRVAEERSNMIQKAGASVRFTNQVKQNFVYSPALLRDIFDNLLTNALQFRSMDRMPEVVIHCEDVPEGISISFADNGIGIDLEKYSHKLFRMHGRLQTQGVGRGIGLYLIKKQVDKLGGEVQVTSKLEEGSIFTVILHNQHS